MFRRSIPGLLTRIVVIDKNLRIPVVLEAVLGEYLAGTSVSNGTWKTDEPWRGQLGGGPNLSSTLTERGPMIQKKSWQYPFRVFIRFAAGGILLLALSSVTSTPRLAAADDLLGGCEQDLQHGCATPGGSGAHKKCSENAETCVTCDVESGAACYCQGGPWLDNYIADACE